MNNSSVLKPCSSLVKVEFEMERFVVWSLIFAEIDVADVVLVSGNPFPMADDVGWTTEGR